LIEVCLQRQSISWACHCTVCFF